MNAENRPVRRSVELDGALVRLVLDRPKGNVLDAAMIAALREDVARLKETPAARAVLIEGAGAHFSFGASVEEHRGDKVAGLLSGFHGLFRDLAACGKVLLAAVRGQCLGGGLELAAYCHRVFAAPDAKLGNPEIKLGVIAPVASAVLPHRVGRARADDLLLTGRSLSAPEALACGLVDELADDPSAAAAQWVATHLVPLSASSLAHAARAARFYFDRDVGTALDALERLYLEDLQRTHDAHEGLESFLAKRSPVWKHR